MKRFIQNIKNIWKVEELRSRILLTLGLILIYRIGSFVVLPGVNYAALVQTSGDQNNTLENLLSLFSGGGFTNASIMALGIMPYISASIIMQLLGMAVPAVQKMQNEGESGRKQINNYTRILTIAICALQAPSYLNLYLSGKGAIPADATQYWWVQTTIILIAGAMFAVWLGERITEKGIGHKGISCFIVEKGLSGFETGKAENKLGIRSSDTCELYLDDVKVPAENLIGCEGEGFKIALSVLDGGRIGIASQALGIAQASLDASVSYSKDRVQFGKPIAHNQAIQFKIADMAMEIEAARLLIWKAAWAKDNHQNFGVLASMAKVYASEVAMKASTQCVQIHGGYGYIKETGVERLMRDAKITQIYEGTSEIQRVVIARALL